MTTRTTETSTAIYVGLYADYQAQCESADMLGLTPEERNEALDTVKREFSKDPKYALLAKHNFQPPTSRTRRTSQSELDRIVETHGL